MACFF